MASLFSVKRRKSRARNNRLTCDYSRFNGNGSSKDKSNAKFSRCSWNGKSSVNSRRRIFCGNWPSNIPGVSFMCAMNTSGYDMALAQNVVVKEICQRSQQPFSEEQEVNLPVGGRLFYHKQVWKELGLQNFCREVVNGLKIDLLPNFKPMPNPIPFPIPEGPKSDCITKEVQDLLLDDAIEQVFPNRYSKRVFYYNVFTVPKPGTTIHRPVLYLKRLNTYINNQSFKMEGIKNLPSMVKQGYSW
ncbi:hypothetical protein ACTFIW_005424 [Dictyostelium discoideum]